jgi:hypothetical protein
MVTKFEAKKHAWRQTQDGIVVSFVIHPDDVDGALAVSPLGTRYYIAIVPAEQADADAAKVPVLEAPATSQPEPKGKTAWDDMDFVKQAGIRCNDPQFQHWLAVRSAEAAADAVRKFCGVESRSALKRDTVPGAAWQRMDRDFRDYQTDQQYAGSRR